MKQFLFRISTSLPMYLFVIILVSAFVLLWTGNLEAGSFVFLSMGIAGIAIGINKADDAIDPSDYSSYGEFLKSLLSRGVLIFILLFPTLIVVLCLKLIDGNAFAGAATTLMTMALGSKTIADLIQAKSGAGK